MKEKVKYFVAFRDPCFSDKTYILVRTCFQTNPLVSRKLGNKIIHG